MRRTEKWAADGCDRGSGLEPLEAREQVHEAFELREAVEPHLDAAGAAALDDIDRRAQGASELGLKRIRSATKAFSLWRGGVLGFCRGARRLRALSLVFLTLYNV